MAIRITLKPGINEGLNQIDPIIYHSHFLPRGTKGCCAKAPLDTTYGKLKHALTGVSASSLIGD